jgi:hypothetical protein
MKLNGNAVVGIISHYKRAVFTSTTEYECHAGSHSVGVTLEGRVAKAGP